MKRFLVGAAMVLALAATLPAVLKIEYYYVLGFTVLQFIIMATAWNILGGFAGYVNFGSGAFFAVGAYTAVSLYKGSALPLGLQILAGAAMAGLLGLGVGLLTLRLRGIFFSIATIAITIILETVVLNWTYVGGAKGLPILRPTEIPLFEQLHAVAVLRDGGDRRGRGRGRALHPVVLDRPRPARDPRQRGRRRMLRRADAQAQARRGDRLRRADGRGGRAVRDAGLVHRAELGVQPEPRRERAGDADHRRHRALDRAGDRRGAAGQRAADRHRDRSPPR